MNVITSILDLAAPYLNGIPTNKSEFCLVDLGAGDVNNNIINIIYYYREEYALKRRELLDVKVLVAR